MSDKDLSLGWVAAYGLWVAGGVVLLISLAAYDEMARVAIGILLLAATATVRQFHVLQARLIRNAFELGRDVERRNVTSLSR